MDSNYFHPTNLIKSIPYFKSQDINNLGIDDEFLKNKLLKAEKNQQIIRLARGDGRYKTINNILSDPKLIFDWGEKSMHSYMEASEMRDFLSPNYISKELLYELLEYLESTFIRHQKKYRIFKDYKKIYDTNEKIRKAIKNTKSDKDLLLIKEWITAVLHTSSSKDFKKMSTWVSTTKSNRRYYIASNYGNLKKLSENKNKFFSPRNNFIIFDYWEKVIDENITYRDCKYVSGKLKSMGINWHSKGINEVMVKYALFPSQLIGYYYFDNDKLQYYVVNDHYLEKWLMNKKFKIGDEVYIDVAKENFPIEIPFNIIYTKNTHYH